MKASIMKIKKVQNYKVLNFFYLWISQERITC